MTLDWRAQLLRISLFSNAPIALTEQSWKVISGQDEAEHRMSIPGGKQFSGQFAGGHLSLGFSGPRLDCILQAGPPSDPAELKLPVLGGSWKESFNQFSSAVTPLLSAPGFPVVRLALGVVLLAQADTRQDAYEELSKLLKSVKVDAQKMGDLVYRVNWARKGKSVPVMFNRLTNWSSVHMSAQLVQVTGTNLALSEGGSQLIATRLELDHNTDGANSKPFEQQVLVPIFEELFTMACENAELGEIPC